MQCYALNHYQLAGPLLSEKPQAVAGQFQITGGSLLKLSLSATWPVFCGAIFWTVQGLLRVSNALHAVESQECLVI